MRCAGLLTVIAIASCTALVGAPSARADTDDATCFSCHDDKTFADDSGKSLFVPATPFDQSPHKAFGCTGCHDDAAEVPHPDKLKPVGLEACATCHDEQVAAYREGMHGKSRDAGVVEAATCTDCHGSIHAIVSHTEPASKAHWTNLVKTCAACHAKPELADKFSIPVARSVATYLASGHARAIKEGKRAAVCSDCHGVHDIRPSHDPASPIARQNLATTCAQCHGEIVAKYQASVHGRAVARGEREAPSCIDCHGEHRILGPKDPNSPVAGANVSTQTCGRCHGDERLNEKFGLPGGNVAAFESSFHGLALRSGQRRVAHCDSCHGVHDILPSSDPRSSIHPTNVAATCGKCHPGAGSSFQITRVHATGDAPGAQAASWVRWLYLWLISLTIGGMVLHNLLDLQRKARSPRPPLPPLPPGPPRMTRVMRWQHGLVIVSFTLLVYSGFALTYPESWWASFVLSWETTYPLRGIVHRAAAVVLMVALGWHIGQLIVSRKLRRIMRAALPGWSDLRQLRDAFAYYLGRRAEPPHAGVFGYAEKAEYWAFLWGMGVMSVTGLLLWFENTTLRYLPVWTADVATALHFWEAVLATLAIVVWHFYWVIFDPDVYPMDWTWWNGQPPAARQHERAACDVDKDDPPAR